MLIDAHNSNDGVTAGDLGHVVPGSQRSFDLIDAAGTVTAALDDASESPPKLGVAWDRTPWTPEQGIGPLGVRVAVLETGDERSAHVLVDGNNMEPGLRDRIVSRLESRGESGSDVPSDVTQATAAAANGGTVSGRVSPTDGGDRASRSASRTTSIDVAEVMTTDTHIVNTVDSVNQVGAALPAYELVELIEGLVTEAIRDREPVEVGMSTENAQVTVFGNDRTETLASHANAMIGMGGALALAVIAAVMAISVLVFFLAGS